MPSVFLIGMFIGAALWGAVTMLRLKRLTDAVSTWKPVPGRVIEYEELYSAMPGFALLMRHEKDDPIGVDCRFRAAYSVDGTEYFTRKLSLLDFFIMSPGNATLAARKEVETGRVTGSVTLWVSPTNPRVAVLDRRLDPRWCGYYWMHVIGAPLVALLIWIAIR